MAQSCNMEQHVIDSTNKHLLLAVNRLSECSSTSKDLVCKVALLEKENRELRTELKNSCSIVDDKVTKTAEALAGLEAAYQNELKKLSSGKQ